MITTTDNDDPLFVAIANGLLDASVASYRPAEIHLVCIDRWFDAKWLNFSGKVLGALGVWRSRTTIPPFHPHRVLGESHYSVSPDAAGFVPTLATPLHVAQPSDQNLTRSLSRVSRSAVFLWYSSSTLELDRGSTMLYCTHHDEVFSWYASFHRFPEWHLDRYRGISRSEIEHLLQSALQHSTEPRLRR